MNRVQTRHVVLCVDDEPMVLRSLSRSLAREPYELLMTGSPDTALGWVKARDISLVISDQRMPQGSGAALLEQVRQLSPTTARIVLTGFPWWTAAILRIRLTAERLFPKPWDDRSLRQAIREVLRERELRHLEEIELLKE